MREFSSPEKGRRTDSFRVGSRQTVTLAVSRKARGGKTVTVISDLQHCPQALEKLAREIKAHCGCGGTVKHGEIIIQGDQRQRVAKLLQESGYQVRFSGG